MHTHTDSYTQMRMLNHTPGGQRAHKHELCAQPRSCTPGSTPTSTRNPGAPPLHNTAAAQDAALCLEGVARHLHHISHHGVQHGRALRIWACLCVLVRAHADGGAHVLGRLRAPAWAWQQIGCGYACVCVCVCMSVYGGIPMHWGVTGLQHEPRGSKRMR